MNYPEVLSVGSLGNERNDVSLRLVLHLGLFLGLFLSDLLHLEHPLHDELVLALLIRVAFVAALPREVHLRLPALVQRDQQVRALVPVG